jgi:hypothetical protein
LCLFFVGFLLFYPSQYGKLRTTYLSSHPSHSSLFISTIQIP